MKRGFRSDEVIDLTADENDINDRKGTEKNDRNAAKRPRNSPGYKITLF